MGFVLFRKCRAILIFSGIFFTYHTAPSKMGEHCNSSYAGHYGYYCKTCILHCSVWFCQCSLDNFAHTFWNAGKQHRQIWMKLWLGTKCITYCVSFAPNTNCISFYELSHFRGNNFYHKKVVLKLIRRREYCGMRISSFLPKCQGNEAYHLPRIATWSRVGICIVQSMCWLSINKSDMAHNERKHLKTRHIFIPQVERKRTFWNVCTWMLTCCWSFSSQRSPKLKVLCKVKRSLHVRYLKMRGTALTIGHVN